MTEFEEKTGENRSSVSTRDFRAFSVRILHRANRGVSRIPFLRSVLNNLLEFSGCDAVELRICSGEEAYRCEIRRHPRRRFVYETLQQGACREPVKPESGRGPNALDLLYRRVMKGELSKSSPNVTRNGSLWIRDTSDPEILRREVEAGHLPDGAGFEEGFRSILLIPFVLIHGDAGLLYLKSFQSNFFSGEDIETYESAAQTVGLAIADRRLRADCHERVKELTCLYGIARVTSKPGLELPEILLEIAALLPPAWQYPEITRARITLDGKTYGTQEFPPGSQIQSAEITVNGERRGCVEVCYVEEKPNMCEGPFLKEERSLIDTVAKEVGLVVERKEAEQYRRILEEQLRHADRLATLGQLAAGVAHELNEPIAAALGFAQLAKKCPGLPEQCSQDLDKIIKASLHAREVVRKLLLFARQMPAQMTRVNLNSLVQEGLYFLESRCAKQQIALRKELDPALPDIVADPALLHQVLVNLVVNAVQAMPDGGELTIETRAEGDRVILTVTDTGEGMSEDVLKRIFVPFFTTKDVGQGTGLGLSVVHGIVTSHGGKVEVSTQIGKGTTFRIILPIEGPKERKENQLDG